MKSISTALILLVALIGCREVITGPDPNPPSDPIDPSGPSPTATPEIYLKGPKSMREGEVRNLRGAPVPPIETATYSWQWTSPDGAAIEFFESTDSFPNEIDATAIRSGTVRITVMARDIETDTLRGVGRITIPVCSRGTSECPPQTGG